MNKGMECITGPGGLVMMQIENRHARALISRYGGQVLSYQPRSDCGFGR
jgi:D-hexose-6-phosphate mutarotase